jgi:ubiquinone biosynthesis protein COQ4
VSIKETSLNSEVPTLGVFMSSTQSVPVDAMSFSTRERLSRAAHSLLALARDPTQLERVFEIGEALNSAALPRLLDRLERSDPEVKRLLDERPAIDTRHVDFDALAALADGSLGREYVRFLRDNGIDPDVFPKPNVADERVSYVMQRIRQTHDLWHVLTGYTPDIGGEIVLQAFTFAQLRAPSSLLITIMGVARHGHKVPAIRRRVLDGYRRGRTTKKLAAYRWEEHWADPLDKVRADLGCPPAAA